MIIKYQISNNKYNDIYFPILTQVPRVNDIIVLNEKYHQEIIDNDLSILVIVNHVIWNEYGILLIVSEFKFKNDE